MIPDFKTYLKESVWGSIRKKSLGLETRIEDDVNKLDGEAFVGYIKQHYECVGTEYEPFIDVKKCITVPLFVVSNKTQFLSFNEKTDTVYLSEHSMLRDNPVYDQLRNEFSLEEKAYSCPGHFTKDDIIRPKMGYGSKKFFLEVIDFLLKNTGEPFKPVLIKKDSVYESVWGDIRKKSLGQKERLENDVNLMDFNTFAEYIKDTYSERSDWFAIRESENGKSRHIEIDIISGITLSFNEVDGKIYNILVQSVNKHVDVPGLKKVFNINVLGSSTYSVLEKDWTKSNNTFVKLIEFFLDKKTYMNESIWGDIRKKSLGQEERLENDVNLMDYEELGNYILENYNLADEDGLSWSYTKGNASGIGIFIIRLDDDDNLLEYFTAVDDDDSKRVTVYPNIEKLDPNLYNKLKETYKLYDTEDRIGMMSLLGIDPKDGRNVDNKFFIEVLNFIIDNLDSKYRKIIDR